MKKTRNLTWFKNVEATSSSLFHEAAGRRFYLLLSAFCLGTFLFLNAPSANAETAPVWTKYDNTIPADSDTNSTNGRLAIGTATKGDITYTMDPIVIMDGGTYKMWYSGYDSKYRVYYAGATNPLVWTKYDNTPQGPSDGNSQNGRVPLGTAGRGDTNAALGACVIADGGIYRMWYAGYDSNSPVRVRIYYATSSNGLDWTKYDNTVPTNSDTTSDNGRIPLGTSGAGDTNYTWRCWVIKDDGIYKMWYTGYNGVNYRIYYATSSNALDWTKYDNSIPTNSNTTSDNGRIPLGTTGRGDVNGTMRPVVVKDGTTYKMWYSGSDGANWRIYYATSTNGLDWVKYDNTIPSPSNGSSTNGRVPLGTGAGRGDITAVYAPMVVKDGATYRMWYEGYGGAGAIYQIYYATSTNGGLTWTKQDNTVPPASDSASTGGRIPIGKADRGDDAGVMCHAVIKDGATYKMWYHGSDGASWRIYYATSSDGLTWTKYNTDVPTASNGSSSNGCVPLGSGARGDVTHASWPCVVKDGTDYKMWYSGYSNSTWRIFYATSSNGLDWLKYDNTTPTNSNTTSSNGRIPLGTNGMGDDVHTIYPWVIVDGTTHKMWYSGYDGANWRIYHATSTNGGLDWTKYDNSTPPNSDTTSSNGRIPLGTSSRGDSATVCIPLVVKDGGTYRMWYSGYDGLNYRIFYATSSNGLDWVKYDNSIPVNSDTATSNGRIALGVVGTGDDYTIYPGGIIQEGTTYKMWYTGSDGSTSRTYYATTYIGARASLIFSE